MINMIFNSELIALNLLDGILVDLASVSNKNYSFQSFKYKFNELRKLYQGISQKQSDVTATCSNEIIHRICSCLYFVSKPSLAIILFDLEEWIIPKINEKRIKLNFLLGHNVFYPTNVWSMVELLQPFLPFFVEIMFAVSVIQLINNFTRWVKRFNFGDAGL